MKDTHTESLDILIFWYTLISSIAGPLPNFYVANSPLSDNLEFSLTTFCFLCWPSGTQLGNPLGLHSPEYYIEVCFSVLHFLRGGVSLLLLLPAWWISSFFSPQSLAQESKNPTSVCPAQPLAVSIFIYQSEPTGGRFPEATCVQTFSCKQFF